MFKKYNIFYNRWHGKKNQKTKQKKTATTFSDIATGATIYVLKHEI